MAGKGRYRGRVEIFPNPQGRLTVVNTVDLETYLRGVVPKEMGAWEFPALEALKAQAVAARTYAYVNLGKRAKEGFDLVDTVADQVLRRPGRGTGPHRPGRGRDHRADRHLRRPAHPGAVHGQRRRRHRRQHLRVRRRHPVPEGGQQLRRESADLAVQGRRWGTGAKGGSPGRSCAWPRTGCWPRATWTGGRMHQPLSGADLRPVLDAVAVRLGRPRPRRRRRADPSSTCGWPGAWASRRWWPAWTGPRMPPTCWGTPLPAGPGPAPGGVPGPPRAWCRPPAWRNPAPTLAQAPAGAGPAVAGAGAPGLPGRHPAAGRPGAGARTAAPAPCAWRAGYLLAEEAPGGSPAPGGQQRHPGGGPGQVAGRSRRLPVLVRRLDPDGASLDRYNPMAHWKVELKEADLLDKPAHPGRDPGRARPAAQPQRPGAGAGAGRPWTTTAGPTASPACASATSWGSRTTCSGSSPWASRPSGAGSSTAGAGATGWAWTRPAPTAWPWRAPPSTRS